MSEAPYRILGKPSTGGVLIIGDHASNRVPDGVDLGIDPALLNEHIAWDIGVAPVAKRLTESAGYAAILGNVSRLVTDFNRYPDEPSVIPLSSDGIAIVGNAIDDETRRNRINQYYQPYHSRISEIVSATRSGLILSLHSFTPRLRSLDGEPRPWEIGILYGEQETASKAAIAFLRGKGIVVGDQLPYSGKLLNATMNRHAEANAIPYIGVEMRQDLVDNEAGRTRFALILRDMCSYVAEQLGLTTQNP